MYRIFHVGHLRSVKPGLQMIIVPAADAALGHAPLTQNRCCLHAARKIAGNVYGLRLCWYFISVSMATEAD
jgi:hypothetical protein